MNAYTDGYIAGVRDMRTNRYPEHSQTHYRFPATGTLDEQREYNTAYNDARNDMEEARELNARWIETHCLECYQLLTNHHEDCEANTVVSE